MPESTRSAIVMWLFLVLLGVAAYPKAVDYVQASKDRVARMATDPFLDPLKGPESRNGSLEPLEDPSPARKGHWLPAVLTVIGVLAAGYVLTHADALSPRLCGALVIGVSMAAAWVAVASLQQGGGGTESYAGLAGAAIGAADGFKRFRRKPKPSIEPPHASLDQ